MSRRLMLRNKSGGSLPPEFQHVEWIGAQGLSSSSTGPRIQTNLQETTKNELIQYEVIFTSRIDKNTYESGVGMVIGFSTRAACYFGSTASFRMSGASDGYNFSLPSQIVSSDKHTYKLTWSQANGLTYETDGYSATRPWMTTDSAQNLFIGTGISKSNVPSWFKIYGVTVYKNSQKTGEFIPCYRKSNGVIGMYDTVSNTFFTNAGTGSFTKGADVT